MRRRRKGSDENHLTLTHWTIADATLNSSQWGSVLSVGNSFTWWLLPQFRDENDKVNITMKLPPTNISTELSPTSPPLRWAKRVLSWKRDSVEDRCRL